MPRKSRILCVDDHTDFCDLVSAILKDYEVVSAHSKIDGLRKVEGGLFDLYLFDYSLLDGTGLELAALIRQFDDSTPILIITGTHDMTRRSMHFPLLPPKHQDRQSSGNVGGFGSQ